MKVYHPTLAEIIKKDGPLNEAEAKFVDCCKTGKEAVFGNELPTEATNANTIRANLIRLAMLGGCEGMSVGPKGVQIQGAWITEVLDLRGCESPLDLVLARCKICEQPVLRDARLGALILPGCDLIGLDAHRITVTRDILLYEEFNSKGMVDFGSATIGGQLNCNDSYFDGAGSTALNCDAISVGTITFLNGKFTAKGRVNMRGAQISGQFSCSGATFNGAGGMALNCNAMSVGENVFFGNGFKATGEVNLRGAQIEGQLDCSGGMFVKHNSIALDCRGVSVGRDVFLRKEPALNASLPKLFTATGEVHLGGAQIAGQLSCSGATFNGAGGMALNCNAMSVGADIFLTTDFEAIGMVDFLRIQITGHLLCQKAIFNGSFDCESMTVGSGFFWKGVSKPPSTLNLTDAHVGSLRDDQASWKDCTPILNGFRYDQIISDMSVRDRLEWLDSMEHKDVATTKYAKNTVPDVDPQPYTQLAQVLEEKGARRSANRVRYERTKRINKAEHAKELVASERESAGCGDVLIVRLQQGVDIGAGILFGLGYRLERALIAFFAIWLFSVTLYGYTYDRGQMAPNSAVILTSVEWRNASIGYTDENRPPKPAEYTQNEWVAYTSRACLKKEQPNCTMPLHLWEASKTSTDYETFNRYLYALDLFVPLDALGQENAWAPSKDRGWWGWWAYSLRWVIQMLGWIITAIGAAALTGVIGRKE